jgi:hypothetical protein
MDLELKLQSNAVKSHVNALLIVCIKTRFLFAIAHQKISQSSKNFLKDELVPKSSLQSATVHARDIVFYSNHLVYVSNGH